MDDRAGPPDSVNVVGGRASMIAAGVAGAGVMARNAFSKLRRGKKADDSAEALEDDAVDSVLTDHDLPDSDRERVLGWARNDVRARLYNRLVNIANTSFAERTESETNSVLAIAYAMKVKRIQAIAASLGARPL